MTAPEILTFGCRLNAFESEVMRGHAADAGLEDAIIVNSCAVTAEAERQVRQSIRRARRENPDAEIIVTGCAAQIDPDRYAAMDEVDRVIGNEEKLRAETWKSLGVLDIDTPRVSVNDIMTVRETAPHLISGFEGRARAFVEIQQGCGRQKFRVAWIDFEQQGELLSSTCVVTLGAQQAGILQPQLLIGGKGGNAVFQSLQRIGQGLIELELCPQHDGANILRRAL